jgi:hypothetical protein
MNTAVLCRLGSIDEAQHVVAALQRAGFPQEAISVLLARAKDEPDAKREMDWLAGMGTIEDDEIGSFYAAGPVLASLSAAQEDAAVGGTLGVLRSMGLSEAEAERHLADVEAGSVLVGVHVQDPTGRDLARQTCLQGGAVAVRLTTED